MTSDKGPRVVRLDSAKLRALAHPLRSRLVAALRVYGPATSTSLAKRLDTNTGATSYHLRKLAEVGMVEEDHELGQGRERWWRASHEVTSWVETQFLDDPDDRAAADWLKGQYMRNKSQWVADWLATRDKWSHEWLEAADSSDMPLWLTPERAKALGAELHEVLERYRRAGGATGVDVQRVVVLLDLFPSPEPRI